MFGEDNEYVFGELLGIDTEEINQLVEEKVILVTSLADVRVVELADPYGEWCGRLLAGLGADVIKIEPPGGAPTRRIGPFVDDIEDPERSLYFWHYNSNKRSVVVDVDDPEQRDGLRSLIATADVFIETLPPGRAPSLGLDYATLSASHDCLVQVAITPFGQTGPYIDAGYSTTDLVTMALGGPLQSCGYDRDGEPDPPVRPGANHSYHTASHYACIAVLCALFERETSGRGQYVDVSAQAALAVTVEFANLYWEYNRGLVSRQTGRHAYPRRTAPTQYLCADGKYINLAIPLEEHAWRRLAAYLREEGLGEGLDDDAAKDPVRRLELGSVIYDKLAVLTGRYSSEELFHAGQQLGLTWAPVRAPEEWLRDPHALDRGFFANVDHPDIGRTATYPGAPYQFSETPCVPPVRAPFIGEHTAALLRESAIEPDRSVSES